VCENVEVFVGTPKERMTYLSHMHQLQDDIYYLPENHLIIGQKF
jgi:hypothetical protein